VIALGVVFLGMIFHGFVEVFVVVLFLNMLIWLGVFVVA